MGIYTHLLVSRSVTKAEWKAVYKETLKLVEAFPLAYIEPLTAGTKRRQCLTHSSEMSFNSDVFKKNRYVGWQVCGNYDTLETAETYEMHKDMVHKKTVDPGAGDAILGAVPYCLRQDDSKYKRVYDLWGDETPIMQYQFYLLAIACLIESRLGEKAFVCGKLRWNLCDGAVRLANQYLEKPITLPACCDSNRLEGRIQALPVANLIKDCLLDTYYVPLKGENSVRLDHPEFLSPDLDDCPDWNYFDPSEDEFYDLCDDYDIMEYGDLITYEKGDRILPPIEMDLLDEYLYVRTLCSDKYYRYLSHYNPSAQFVAIMQASVILIREKDWQRIYEDLDGDSASFDRYYELSQLRPESRREEEIAQALMINKDLYDHCKDMADRRQVFYVKPQVE